MLLDLGEKTKFIIIALATVLVISIFINLSTYSAKKAIERERNDLRTENTTLSKKIDEAAKEIKQLEDKVKVLNSDLDKITQEQEDLRKQKEEIQKKFELIVKERDELQEKLKASPTIGEGKEAGVSTKEEAYWAEVLKSKTDLSLQTEKLRSELKTLQIDNKQLHRDLASLTREKEELEQKLAYNQKTFDNITSQLVLDKGAKFQIQDALRPIKAENATLRKQLKSLNAHKLKLESQVQQLKEEKVELERRLDEIQLFVEDRLARTKDLELKRQLETAETGGQKETVIKPKREAIELPPIVVRPQTETSTPRQPKTEMPTLEEKGAEAYTEGSILGVNKENNFVVIDLGRNAGIEVGETFQVYRGGRAIATIEVVELRESVSACDIKEETEPIEAGDTVR